MGFRTTRTFVLVLTLIATATAATAEASLITVPLFSHPNGNASANVNAVDSRDYGLRLDNSQGVNSFHFESVTMTFFDPQPALPGSTFATISGTIAHLQSSNGVALGYSGTSGLDGLDQRWAISATIRGQVGQGSIFQPTLPNPNMLDQLIAADISNNAINDWDFDVTLTPLFNENVTPAIYTGPRSLVENTMGGTMPGLIIDYRHRLDPNVFAAPQWDVATGHGWLKSASGHGTEYTRDFLFHTPEPGTVGLLLAGLMSVLPRRRRVATA
jgi:hypothetical protein